MSGMLWVPIGIVAVMLAVAWWRVRPRRDEPEPLVDIRTSPWADELADRGLSDSYQVEVESRRPL